MSTEEIYNYIEVHPSLVASGQPTEDQLRSAAAEGFIAVINLATYNPRYSLENEAELVQSLGMNYYPIPVDWENPRQEDFAAFEHQMKQLPESKTLLHCAANFRATAFYGLYATKHLGWSVEQAEEFRAPIWQGSDYPIWEAFITRIRAQEVPE